ncbi:MAG TPA: phosphoribosylglycinamide formyltransferase [Dehalococcoidia bacterium]|nr:phosphoribosylglycinamide formyltransferase [Dehalococcoidia bacterium]
MTIKLAALVSGGGTTLQNFLDIIARGELDARFEVVVSSMRDAYALERAKAAGIPTHVVRRRDFETQEAFSEAITAVFARYNIDLVVLAGFLQRYIYPPHLEGRVLNVHPGLLPKYGGQGMWGHHVHEAVLAAGEEESGCSVIIADHEYDHGPTIIEKRVPVLAGDTPETLEERVMGAEREIYPEAVRLMAAKLGLTA